MKQIILPTDFSDNAWKAMSYAADLYHGTPCEFYIINTYRLPTRYPEAGAMMPFEVMGKASKEQLEGILKQFKDLDHHSLSEFETKSICGSLTDVVKNLEETLANHPIIVMGTRGFTGIGELFFGSNSSQVIEKCKSPVICVPNSALLSTPKNIMFAMDKHPISSEKEIEPLIELAEKWNSKIATVHVNDTALAANEKSVGEIVSDYYLNRVEYSYHTIVGEYIEDELKHFAKENKIELIAMIKRDKGFWRSFFQPSLTKNMALYAKVPLFVLKAQ